MYQHKDHLGNVRLSYADVDDNNIIDPVTEILEVNNYYPFGLQHTGYGHIDNAHRSEEAEQYKYLDKEYENTYNLNVIETDFRQYDPALGRFVTIDLLSELAPNYTPYRYGFNNPNIFTDPTGLFESVQTALEFAESLGFNNYNISYSAELEGYVVTVIGGQFNGDQFYNFSGLLENIDINVKGSSGGSGGGFSLGRGEPSFLNAFSGALAMGELARQAKTYQFFGKTAQQVEDALANGKYVHKNGKVYSQKFRGNQYISSKSVKNSLGTAKYLKGAGRALTGVSAGIAVYTYLDSDRSGADNARLAGSIIIMGTAAIPVVGPFISIGLGVADSFGAFDSIYNSFD